MEAGISLWVAEDVVPHTQETQECEQEQHGPGNWGRTERSSKCWPHLGWEAKGTIPAGASRDVIGSGLNFGTEDPLESYQSSHF